MERIRLKGGSLSGTYLMKEDSRVFVRKEVSLTQNREYGFQRWYSQLKRMQRYAVLFPNIFPRVLDYGYSGDTAWFDMNYIENAVTAHEFLMSEPNPAKIDRFFDRLLETFALLHKSKIPCSKEALKLYLHEEVRRPLANCTHNKTFHDFQQYKKMVFNSVEVTPLAHCVDRFESLALSHFTHPFETFTHGNATLENMLYVESTNELTFIDPYEETIIDSIFGEYSQVLQSSNSYYEIYNAQKTCIKGNEVVIDQTRYPALDYFNDRFTKFISDNYSESDQVVIKIFEISQFIRMLPFKMAIAPDKMILFYGLGSHLFHQLKDAHPPNPKIKENYCKISSSN